jgi:hypothetical protein
MSLTISQKSKPNKTSQLIKQTAHLHLFNSKKHEDKAIAMRGRGSQRRQKNRRLASSLRAEQMILLEKGR